MLIGPRALKTLNSIERIQPRMMAATFYGNPRATIISCYSPTNVSEETELVTFCQELSSLVHSIPKHNLLVIGGDMNIQIGKNRNNKYIQNQIDKIRVSFEDCQSRISWQTASEVSRRKSQLPRTNTHVETTFREFTRIPCESYTSGLENHM